MSDCRQNVGSGLIGSMIWTVNVKGRVGIGWRVLCAWFVDICVVAPVAAGSKSVKLDSFAEPLLITGNCVDVATKTLDGFTDKFLKQFESSSIRASLGRGGKQGERDIEEFEGTTEFRGCWFPVVVWRDGERLPSFCQAQCPWNEEREDSHFMKSMGWPLPVCKPKARKKL